MMLPLATMIRAWPSEISPEASAAKVSGYFSKSDAASSICRWTVRSLTRQSAAISAATDRWGNSAVLVAAAALAARRRASELPSPGDLALLAVATSTLSRTIAKDAVTSPLRSQFTTFEQAGAPSEVNESPREGSVRHAVGELVSCPFCLAQWVATALVTGYAAAPQATRWVATTFSLVGAADVLQHSYGLLQKASEA